MYKVQVYDYEIGEWEDATEIDVMPTYREAAQEARHYFGGLAARYRWRVVAE